MEIVLPVQFARWQH